MMVENDNSPVVPLPDKDVDGKILPSPFQFSKQFALVHEMEEEPVQVWVEGFEFYPRHEQQEHEQLVVCVQLVLGDVYKTCSVSTSASTSVDAGHGFFREKWGDRLILPFNLCDLPIDAYLDFTITGPSRLGSSSSASDCFEGRSRFYLFDARTGVLRTGRQELDVISSSSPTCLDDAASRNDNENQVQYEREEAQRRKLMREGTGPAWLNAMAEARVLEIRRLRRRANARQRDLLGILAIDLQDFHGVPVLWEKQMTITSGRSYGGEGVFPEISTVRREEEVPNVVEDKLYLMRRSLTRRGAGEDNLLLQPNHKEWKQIDLILSNAFAKPKNEEEDFLWRFRYSLVRDARALTKLLHGVKWDSEEEVNQVDKLLAKWESVDFSDVLRLLSGEITEHPIVRAYAVKVLGKSKASVLFFYLPQLVQALRHDRVSVDRITSQGPLQAFLLMRCAEDFELASCLHWLLKVETMLVKNGGGLFATVRQNFSDALRANAPHFFQRILRQDQFIAHFTAVAQELASGGGGGSNAERRAMSQLEAYDFSSKNSPPVTLTGFPNQIVVGVKRKSVRVLSSTTRPTVVDLLFQDCVSERDSQALPAMPAPARAVRLMFKVGDDVRQDQLVLQLIKLMDDLFKRSGLDLEMTLYRVLATGANAGVIEFVSNAIPLSKVASEFASIRTFLQQCNNPAHYASALDRFIRSCAGYAVATYVLGIGDRHLDNILILPTGRMFHIDFGYSFGRDKRFATPMRLTADMLETMGRDGENKFRALCWEAFKSLRAQAALLLSVVRLMGEANIPDLQQCSVVLAGIQDRLKLNMNDDEAERSLNAMITQSASALGPQFIEYFHTLGQTRSSAAAAQRPTSKEEEEEEQESG